MTTPRWISSRFPRRVIYAAFAAVLDGRQPAVAETAPVGCSIRFTRRRRGDPPAP